MFLAVLAVVEHCFWVTKGRLTVARVLGRAAGSRSTPSEKRSNSATDPRHAPAADRRGAPAPSGKEPSSASRRTQRPRRGARGRRRLARRVSALETLGAPRTGRLRKRVLDGAGARPEPRRTSTPVRPSSRTPWTSLRPEYCQASCRCAAVRPEKPLGDRQGGCHSSAATTSPAKRFRLQGSLGSPSRFQSVLVPAGAQRRRESAIEAGAGRMCTLRTRADFEIRLSEGFNSVNRPFWLVPPHAVNPQTLTRLAQNRAGSKRRSNR